jgi:hypothetical protein
MTNKTGKRIPITAAKKIGEEFGYTQVIIHAYDSETGCQCVTSWGKSLDDCENAARGGNAIKKLLGWPSELCNAVPNRTKNRKKKE